MSSVFVIFLTVLTSLLTYLVTRAKPGAKAIVTASAFRALLEWVGLCTFFLVINLMLGATAILLIRGLTQRFLTLYDLENPLFLILSAVQGFIVQFWWNRQSYNDH